MASKAAKAAFGGSHTAGIYADMTVDGPEIGTLVVIVDRAKNLPNRKAMGKQDPYCAARLGKEAKKTETDKRGGQTPRWDQELRFTVHESPDYYQLKVSVFNDDKRTELIGETRIGLEDIIIPGGGQNDTWHHLNCKGRFAGEIRIELTYYDTRPKEDKPTERLVEPTTDGSREPSRDSAGGPRGPKPLKRRPLPANPTGVPRPGMPEHTHSSPLPQPTQPMINQPTPSHPDHRGHRDHWLDSTPPPGNRHQYPQQSINSGSPMGHGGYDHQHFGANESSPRQYEGQSRDDSPTQNTALHMPAPPYQDRHPEQYASTRPHHDFQADSSVCNTYQDIYDSPNRHASLPPFATYDHGLPREERTVNIPYNEGYVHSSPSIPHGNSMPDVRDPVHPRHLSHQPQRHSLPGGRGHSEQLPPVLQHSTNGSFDPYPDQQQDTTEAADDVPPPPPAHRTNSGISSSPLGSERSHSENCAPIIGTAPLNIRKERGSFSNSPLSQVQTNQSYASHTLSTSPSHAQYYAPSSAGFPTRHAQTSPAAPQPYHRRSISPVRNGNAVPLSLVPGYEPAKFCHEPENVTFPGPGRSAPTSHTVTAPQYSPTPSQGSQPRAHHAATIHTQSPLQALERGPGRQPHRASAPTVQPRALSPDTRTPVRKSVSPRPESGHHARRGSAIPFGPDSYDAFNPYISSATAGTSPGARYERPDQAKEPAIQHEREESLGDGPIIGNDGRVIDPSDHLPTDTWAPEPESKAPKKTAQVNFRFRNSPQGAQPMPPSGRRPIHDGSARPASISTPNYSNNGSSMPENISPTTAARARLQKRTPAQPHSSPIVPTVNTALQNPVLRSTAADYPLREHENYGHGNSPTYNRPSPTGHPPPVPGKVPMGMGQEDWRRDPLSEELSRIDIGVGGGRSRRNRYGG
ncbi:MAG: hypothetical protein Q9182_003291 [Xanthomendoza sp. 2 TL-2023]